MKPSLVIKLRDYVERCIDSGEPEFIEFIAYAEERRSVNQPVTTERRKVISLAYMAAGAGEPPPEYGDPTSIA